MKTTRHEERKATERLYRAITGRRPLALSGLRKPKPNTYEIWLVRCWV